MESKIIAHFRNGIGNFITLTPALQALAGMDESGMIDICTDKTWFDSRKNPLLDIWSRLSFINNIYAVEDVKDKKYKTWFWTQWNSGGESLEFFKTKKFYDPGHWDMLNLHESDFYMDIIRRFYGYTGDKPPQIIVPSPDAPQLDKSKKNIVLCNGGFGELCSVKKWNRFGKLAHEIKHFFRDTVSVIKIGYRNELSDVADFDFDYVNTLSITESAGVIKQADLVITDDTGNMHVADALGVPMIVLWGGSIVEKNKPINAKCKLIHLKLPCQPCQLDGRYNQCESFECISGIRVGEVMYHIRSFFDKGEFNDDVS